jgi:Animal haem peroxidase
MSYINFLPTRWAAAAQRGRLLATVPHAPAGDGEQRRRDMHGFTSRGSYVPLGVYTPEGRFGRLLPQLDARTPTRPNVAAAMGAAGGCMDSGLEDGTRDSPALAAGFTFLSQFFDNDLDFDPTSSLERQVDPSALSNFRTPAFDLDNIYGAGPAANPHLYDNTSPGTKLLVGASDLARTSRGTALIGDPRNDENMVLAQVQMAFLKCHNTIVDHLVAGSFIDVFGAPAKTNTTAEDLENSIFIAAQQLMRWHYQWMIVHEFLPLFCGTDIVEDVLKHGPRFFHPDDAHQPFIPVEFSVAAYRFGHATIRSRYAVNATYTLNLFPANPGAPTSSRTDLRGGPVDPAYAVDFSKFFDRNPASPAQRAKRIEPQINTLLVDLPNSVLPADLRAIANELGGKTIPLSDDQLREVYLWYYLLAESFSQYGGDRLGDTAARIVAETFIGVLDADALSYRSMYPGWTPTLPAKIAGTFTIVDFLNLAGV